MSSLSLDIPLLSALELARVDQRDAIGAGYSARVRQRDISLLPAGGTIGRVASTLAGARFQLDGKDTADHGGASNMPHPHLASRSVFQ